MEGGEVSECIAESQIQIDGIHGEGYGLEIFFEQVVQSPGEMGIYLQVAECFPVGSYLYSPLEFTFMFAEVVGCHSSVGKVDFIARRVSFTEVSLIDISGEGSVQQIREVWTGMQTPAW